MRSVATVRRGLLPVMLVALLVLPTCASAALRGDRAERAIVRAMNAVRRSYHLPGLRSNGALHRAAAAQSTVMLRSGQLAHGSFTQRLHHYTHSRAIGETLAWMSRCNDRAVVTMWLNSPEHRRIMLSRRFRRVGVGRRSTTGSCMVTADFASAH
jgi:uncharacterized protein YkwD